MSYSCAAAACSAATAPGPGPQRAASPGRTAFSAPPGPAGSGEGAAAATFIATRGSGTPRAAVGAPRRAAPIIERRRRGAGPRGERRPIAAQGRRGQRRRPHSSAPTGSALKGPQSGKWSWEGGLRNVGGLPGGAGALEVRDTIRHLPTRRSHLMSAMTPWAPGAVSLRTPGIPAPPVPLSPGHPPHPGTRSSALPSASLPLLPLQPCRPHALTAAPGAPCSPPRPSRLPRPLDARAVTSPIHKTPRAVSAAPRGRCPWRRGRSGAGGAPAARPGNGTRPPPWEHGDTQLGAPVSGTWGRLGCGSLRAV